MDILADQLAQARARGLAANVAIAANADAAVSAARGFTGLTIIPRGTEAARLRDLPVSTLAPPAEMLETLERWGINRGNLDHVAGLMLPLQAAFNQNPIPFSAETDARAILARHVA